MSLFLASSAASSAALALEAAASAWRMPSALSLFSSSSFSSAASTLAFSAWTLSRCLRLASKSASSCCFRRALSASPCSCVGSHSNYERLLAFAFTLPCCCVSASRSHFACSMMNVDHSTIRFHRCLCLLFLLSMLCRSKPALSCHFRQALSASLGCCSLALQHFSRCMQAWVARYECLHCC